MVEQTDVLLFSCVLDVTRFMCANLELRLTPPFHQTSKTVELDYPPPLPPTPSLRVQRVRGVFLCGDAIANAAVQVINGIAAWGGGGGGWQWQSYASFNEQHNTDDVPAQERS